VIRRIILSSLGILVFARCMYAQQASGTATYTLKATAKTVAWGYYDAKTSPVLRIKSSDTIEFRTLIISSPKFLEDASVPRSSNGSESPRPR
jgi:hypothetical protein